MSEVEEEGGDADEGGEEDLFGKFDDDGAAAAKEELRNSKKGLILLVDCNPSMFERDAPAERECEDDEAGESAGASPFERAMEVAALAMRKRVITDAGAQNLVGVVFYNTRGKEAKYGLENVFPLMTVGGIDIDRIIQARELGRVGLPAVLKEVGAVLREPGALHRALLFCTFCFKEAKLRQMDEQKVWLFTNDAEPFVRGNDRVTAALAHSQAQVLRAKIRECIEAKQTINLWPMVPRERFDERKFFAEALGVPVAPAFVPQDEEAEEAGTAAEPPEERSAAYNSVESCIMWEDGKDREKLENFVRQKDFAKRRLAPVALDLGNGVRLGMDLFPVIMPVKMPAATKVVASTGEAVQSSMTHFCALSTRNVTSDQVQPFLKFGADARVFVSKEEVAALKRLGEPRTLQVLGFKPAASLKPWYSVRPPYLVVPSERLAEGSTKLFNALLQAMLNKGQVALALSTLRATETSRLVALLPRAERRLRGEIVEHAGFALLVLPWADDIRAAPVGRVADDAGDEDDEEQDKGSQAGGDSPELVERARAVINSMRMRNDEHTDLAPLFQNPMLHKHYVVLEKVAMRLAGDRGRGFVREWQPDDDETLPALDRLGRGKCGKALAAFRAAWPGLETPQEARDCEARRKTALAKRSKLELAARKANAADDEPARTRVAKASAPLIDWRQALRSGTLGKLTVPQLKEACRDCELPLGGNKTDLIARLEELGDPELPALLKQEVGDKGKGSPRRGRAAGKQKDDGDEEEEQDEEEDEDDADKDQDGKGQHDKELPSNSKKVLDSPTKDGETRAPASGSHGGSGAFPSQRSAVSKERRAGADSDDSLFSDDDVAAEPPAKATSKREAPTSKAKSQSMAQLGSSGEQEGWTLDNWRHEEAEGVREPGRDKHDSRATKSQPAPARVPLFLESGGEGGGQSEAKRKATTPARAKAADSSEDEAQLAQLPKTKKAKSQPAREAAASSADELELERDRGRPARIQAASQPVRPAKATASSKPVEAVVDSDEEMFD